MRVDSWDALKNWVYSHSWPDLSYFGAGPVKTFAGRFPSECTQMVWRPSSRSHRFLIPLVPFCWAVWTPLWISYCLYVLGGIFSPFIVWRKSHGESPTALYVTQDKTCLSFINHVLCAFLKQTGIIYLRVILRPIIHGIIQEKVKRIININTFHF